jgi:hypothetical protein
MRPTIASALSQVTALADGAQHALGSTTVIDGSTQDQTLFWVTSAGALAGGPFFGPNAAATDVEVKHLANRGALKLVYLLNDSGGTLNRGETLQASAVGTPFQVSLGGAVNPAEIVGVCPFNIPDDTYFWAFCDGIFSVEASAAVTAGAAVVPGADGRITDQVAVTDSALGWATEADAGAGSLVVARIKCPGAPS